MLKHRQVLVHVTSYEHHSLHFFLIRVLFHILNKKSRESRDCYRVAVIMWATLTLSPNSVTHLEVQGHKVRSRIVKNSLPDLCPIGHSHDFRSSVVNDTHVEHVVTVTLGAHKEHVLSVPGAVNTPELGSYPPPSLFITTGNTKVWPLAVVPGACIPAVKATFLELPNKFEKLIHNLLFFHY